MKRKYKEPLQQQFYDRLIELGTPDKVRDAGIFGAALEAFEKGFNGANRPPIYVSRLSAAWIAHYAGHDAAEIKRKA